MWVLGPTTEILFFVWPKKSIQKKGHPQPRKPLRSSLSAGVGRRAIHRPLPTRGIHAAPLRAIPAESSGAQRGCKGPKKEETSSAGAWLKIREKLDILPCTPKSDSKLLPKNDPRDAKSRIMIASGQAVGVILGCNGAGVPSAAASGAEYIGKILTFATAP